MTKLPEPNFIDRDSDIITKEWIEKFEEKSGKVLQPAQIERLMIDVGAYRETVLRMEIQETAKKNLLSYAPLDILKHIGEPLGVEQLLASCSVTTLKLDDLTNTKIGGAELEKDGLSYVIKKNTELFKLTPASGHTSEVNYAGYFLATRKNTGGKYYLWTVARQSGEIVYTYNEHGIRPVVVLKTDVKTSGKSSGEWQLVP